MPNLSDLDLAMLRPGRSVPAVGRLGGGTIAMAGPARPLRVVGRANVVYRLRHGSGRSVALRCPLADRGALDPAMEERYGALVTEPALTHLRGPDGPLVGNAAFVRDGIAFTAADFRSAGHPLVAMDWIDGPTLAEAVDRACRADDRPYLAALADAWAGLLAELGDVSFDHGDLVPDNVLIGAGGGLMLVDYDVSAWPGAPRPSSAVALAPAYAHPSGGAAPIGRRDRFPALVVYASLRILSAWPGLRDVHGEPPGTTGGALLFAPRDLREPDASPLFRQLRGLDNPTVAGLAGVLRDACRGSAAAVPALVEVAGPTAAAAQCDRGTDRMPSVEVGRGEERAGSPAPLGAEPGRPPASGFDAVPRTSEPAARWLPGPAAGADGSAAQRSAPLGSGGADETGRSDSQLRQRRLDDLNGLLLAGDEEAAWRVWTEAGLAGDPAARELAPRMAEVARRRLLRRAREAAVAGEGEALLRLWDEGRFDDYRLAAPLRPAVEAARRRSGSVARLRAAIDAGDRDEVARLWTTAGGAGLGATLAIRARTMLAERTGRAVGEARRRGDDEAVGVLVREARAAGIALDAATRRAARIAADRATTRRELRRAEETGDREALASLALSGRLEELGPLPPATLIAARRALAWPLLARAVAEGDDAAIVAAYDEALFGDDPALAPEGRTRIDLARRRTAWLERVRGALRARDGAALRTELGRTPPGVERRLSTVERGRIERLASRDEAVEALATVLRDGPDAAIVAALNRVEAAGTPLPEALDWAAVRGVADRLSLARAVREAAGSDPPDYALLARLLPTARAAMASAGVGLGAEVDFAGLETDVLRAAHLARLREALRRDDDAAIAAAARPDPFGALAGLNAAQRERVDQALVGR